MLKTNMLPTKRNEIIGQMRQSYGTFCVPQKILVLFDVIVNTSSILIVYKLIRIYIRVC